MSIYQWRCNNCKNEVEVQRPMKDYKVPPEDPCKCGKGEYIKFIGQSTFLLQGGNWHSDEYNSFERRVDKR